MDFGLLAIGHLVCGVAAYGLCKGFFYGNYPEYHGSPKVGYITRRRTELLALTMLAFGYIGLLTAILHIVMSILVDGEKFRGFRWL